MKAMLMKTSSKSPTRKYGRLDLARRLGTVTAWSFVLTCAAVSAAESTPTASPTTLHLNGVQALDFSADRKFVAISEQTGKLTVRRLSDGAIAWATYHCRPGAIAFSSDSSLVASAGICRTGGTTIKLWAAETGALVQTVTNPAPRVQKIMISPDNGLVVAVAEGGCLSCWETTSGQLRWHRTGVAVTDFLMFTPDGATLQSGTSGRPLTLLSIIDGTPVQELVLHRKP